MATVVIPPNSSKKNKQSPPQSDKDFTGQKISISEPINDPPIVQSIIGQSGDPSIITPSPAVGPSMGPSMGPIIDNIDHLKQIVMLYGKNVFKSKPVPDEILTFIVKNFIEKPFLFNGKVVGSMSDLVVEQYGDDIKEARTRQRQQITEFWALFIKHFSDSSIRDPAKKQEDVVGEGTYGALLPYYNSQKVKDTTKLIKYATADKGVYHMDMTTHVEVNYSWFVEFCSFVVIMAILIYVDCNLIIDTSKRTTCITKRYQNIFEVDHVDSSRDISDATDHFLNYYSFMAKIDAPFVNATTIQNEYVMGYIVEAYQSTIYELYRTFGSDEQKFIDAFNLTYQVFEIMNKMTHLANLGIIISHRDITTKNIMYSQDQFRKNRFKIRLIDFGFLCSSIKFKDGKSVVVGYHPFEMRDDLYLCNKRFLDVVLFIAWCIRYNYEIFTGIKSYTKIDAYKRFYNIITLNNKDVAQKFDQRVDASNSNSEWVLSVWDYSAALDGIVEKLIARKKINLSERLDSKRIDKIFTDVFTLMNEVRALLPKVSALRRTTGVEKTDFGTVKMFDISDTKEEGGLRKFYDMYEHNKEAYLELLKIDSVE